MLSAPRPREGHELPLAADSHELVAPARGCISVDRSGMRGWIADIGERVEHGGEAVAEPARVLEAPPPPSRGS